MNAEGLAAWAEVERTTAWRAVLIGNGLSLGVSRRFGYASLYEEAVRAGALRSADRIVFRRLATENFELVLGRLAVASELVAALRGDPTELRRRYLSIQAALGEAVRLVHLPRTQVSERWLAQVKRALVAHDMVFTTNYDLLAYWAMGHEEQYGRLVDLFWSAGSHGPCTFDPSRAWVWPGWTPIFYLHGALHLLVHADGSTRKLTRTPVETLLEQFGAPIPDDPLARPLLVTEGGPREKLRVIHANAYLRHAYQQLRACASPLVVFGSSLGSHDQHLVDAINEHPDRPVAVSIHRDSAGGGWVRQQAAIRSRLITSRLFVFDAATHPLGKLDDTHASAGTMRPLAVPVGR